MSGNYYLILGVTTDASPGQIRSAYREKVKQYHPDQYGTDSGPFLEVQEAYAVLSDPARRSAYDRSLHRHEPRYSARERGPGPDMEPVDLGNVSLGRSFQTFTPSFDDILERLWLNFSPVTRPKAEMPQNLSIDIPLEPEQAIRGGHARIRIPGAIHCPNCRGYGGVGPYVCLRCDGRGEVIREFPVTVSYPSGVINNHAVSVSLTRFGIRNLYLTVRFRVHAA